MVIICKKTIYFALTKKAAMVSDLISTNIPELTPSDTGAKALQIMDDFRVSHLPVVSGTEYIGLVSDNDIYGISDDEPISQCQLQAPQPYAFDTQHIFEVLTIMSSKNLSLLPVISVQNNSYLGVITETQLLRGMAQVTAANMPGGIIEIVTTPENYSPAQIAAVAESNDMKIMSIFTRTDAGNMNIVIKCNGHDTSAVIQGLERYGYRIKQVYEGDRKYTELMEDRYGALMKYLSI